MRLSENIRLMLEAQYHHETLNSFIYDQLANFCEFRGFNNTAEFFKGEADGERGHAKNIISYINEKSDFLNILPFSYDFVQFMELPKVSINSLFEDYFKNSLALEEKTTADLTAIYQAAMVEGDVMSAEIMLHMIKDQAEEEQHYQSILDRFNIYPASPSRDHDIDVWMGETFEND